ncbi:MAG: hypothetical protein J2P38_04865, partial [Candidatus Dormibacteraeota bacterium]|nr:hypothetical protein [Candidatus Dormibacteraeota bacterium]
MSERRSILALDLSGVLFRFDPGPRLLALGEVAGLSPEEVHARVFGSGLSPGWDRGSRTTADAV